ALLARAGTGEGQTAAIALVSRARWLLTLERPAEAARDLERARRLPVPDSTREVALSLLVEAHARSGDRTAAERAADAYRRSYPAGRFEADNIRWLARPMP